MPEPIGKFVSVSFEYRFGVSQNAMFLYDLYMVKRSVEKYISERVRNSAVYSAENLRRTVYYKRDEDMDI